MKSNDGFNCLRCHLVSRGNTGWIDSAMESPKKVIEFLDLRLDMTQSLAFRGGQPVSLTATEFRVLAALVSEPGRIFTRPELVRVALGENVKVTKRTIDVHIVGLRRKLGAPDMIEAVRRQGYRLRGS
jgi:two-component system, OmpR family, phosphate regulon response regulator PhoB